MNPKPNRIDIHQYEKGYQSMKQSVQDAPISESNRQLILDFERACFLKESLSKPRRIKLMGCLKILAKDYIKQDFDTLDKKAIEQVVFLIDSKEDYSNWTKQSYRSILKKFYKWLKQGDDYTSTHGYPDIVQWISTGLRKKDQPRVRASDLLTEEEVKRLIEAAEHPRDKAFVAMLYELGARIGEIGSLRVGDVTRDKYSFLVDLHGKTGHRTPRIVLSDPYITTWLNAHPARGDAHAPLWIAVGQRDKARPLGYGSFRKLLLRLRQKAGIKRRLYAHLFRHTRVTHLLINRQINEAQAKVYFGWVPDSNMLSEYSHLISSDVNDAILALHGIKTGREEESELKPIQCQKCATINTKDARFCHKCGGILDVKTALEMDEERTKADELMAKLVKDPKVQKVLVRKLMDLGLADDLLRDS